MWNESQLENKSIMAICDAIMGGADAERSENTRAIPKNNKKITLTYAISMLNDEF